MPFLLTIAQFVCPLLFFTALTRNPYFTQIALLNAALLAAAALYLWRQAFAAGGGLRLPRTEVDAPLAAWLAVCVLTWTLSYFGHAAFFRPSIRLEGLRAFLFTVINMVIPFYIAAWIARERGIGDEASPGRWALFAAAWGGAWMLFPQLRSAVAGVELWPHLWDGYGGLLWIGGFAAALWLARRGSLHDYWHLALVAAAVSAVYGICQYFSVEWIWPKVLNPYGGRAVSTFGNPNFMSSYYVILMPLAAAYYLEAHGRFHRALYAFVFLAMEGALLCSLTRSSWIGAFASVGALALLPGLKERLKGDLQAHGLAVCLAIAMVLLWPQSAVKGHTPSVVGRVSELASIADTASAAPYSPLYQRVLIWSCAWLMGHENPLLGKGWGVFELFYPFYQGHVLDRYDFFRTMRTHANNSHNEWLELFAQTGLTGVGVNLWLWAILFSCAWMWWRRLREGGRPRPEALWGWAAMSGAFGMLVDNQLNVSMHFAVPGFILWWQAGTAMGLVEPPQGAFRQARLGTGAAKGVAVLAALLAAWGCFFWYGQWMREVRYFAGFKLLRAGRIPAAVDQLEASFRYFPNEVNEVYELGNAYAQAGRWDKAAWGYRAALNANAGYDEIYFNEATVLGGRLGRFEEALDYYRTAFAINPISYPITGAYTQALLREPEKNRDEAIAALERAVHFFPDEPGFRNNLGTLYNRKGDRARAIQLWSEALRRAPDQPQAEMNLRALAAAGGAEPELLRRSDRYHELEARLGKRDFTPETLALARQVAAWFPNSQKVRYYLGNLELIDGSAEKAVELLEPLAQAQPKQAGLQMNIGQAYARLGRRAEAAAAFQRALDAEPGNAQARALLERLSAAP